VPAKRLRLIRPHCVNLADMTPELPEPMRSFFATRHPVLLGVGLLEPEYDFARQIDLLGRVRELHPRAGLVIIGSGSLEAALRAQTASRPWGEHVLLAGDTRHGDTLRAIREAAALLRTTRYDGDAISVREGLLLGTPVVATDNGMRPEGVRRVPMDQPEALETALLDTLRAAGERQMRPDLAGAENLEAVYQLYEEIAGIGA
jgi:glycosyltransferase involved in cell wall biosynthesis